MFSNRGGKRPGMKWRDVSGVRTARLMIGRSVGTASPRSAGQTGAERTNVFLLRCAELLNTARGEASEHQLPRPAVYEPVSRWSVRVCVLAESFTHQLANKCRPKSHHLGNASCASEYSR